MASRGRVAPLYDDEVKVGFFSYIGKMHDSDIIGHLHQVDAIHHSYRLFRCNKFWKSKLWHMSILFCDGNVMGNRG